MIGFQIAGLVVGYMMVAGIAFAVIDRIHGVSDGDEFPVAMMSFLWPFTACCAVAFYASYGTYLLTSRFGYSVVDGAIWLAKRPWPARRRKSKELPTARVVER